MHSRLVGVGLALVLCVASLPAEQEGIRKGILKKVDADKGVVTITADGKDHDYTVAEGTRLFDARGSTVEERLKEFKEGEEVFFKVGSQDVLIGLKRVADPAQPRVRKVDLARLKPLTELGKEPYEGYGGGLYPEGRNERPAAHEKAGVTLAREVQPLDADGEPATDGKIVLLSVGMSNTTQEFSALQRLAGRDTTLNPHLVLVDGAQGGMSAARIINPNDQGTGERFWKKVDEQLRAAGVTRQQVQAVWLKEADAGPSDPFPKHARTLEDELIQIVEVLHDRFPNLKLTYVSSRIFAGYARTPLNPEPYAYESGFAVKWLIEKQLQEDPALNYDPSRGRVRAPWLSWGPYLWANGTTARSDGLSWDESDFREDGTHPSPSGQRKVAEQLLRFFKEDSTTRPWFVKP